MKAAFSFASLLVVLVIVMVCYAMTGFEHDSNAERDMTAAANECMLKYWPRSTFLF